MNNCQHEWARDEDDRRFKICMLCGKIEWRTDEDLLKGVRKDDEPKRKAK